MSVALEDDCRRSVAPADFAHAMRQLASGVSIITTDAGGIRVGVTATAVTSLSISPPSLIVCLNQNSSTGPLAAQSRCFAVNILAADQIDISERFAGKGRLKGEARFAHGSWFAGITGAPILSGALATLECEVEEVIARHTHAILIGRVVHTATLPRKASLAYWQGSYVAIDRDEDLLRLAEVSVPSAKHG
ncbi:flavin reductase family protein [Rhodopseudomonas sp. B29]|uniref:flavin reductase family protein n=1 Tax=Rhodopseudomonas sp. B29 TaxID=95607 RepID=UPI0003475A25|nr:flavin reductase family protein [Rhodopseudomonas sp. B29]